MSVLLLNHIPRKTAASPETSNTEAKICTVVCNMILASIFMRMADKIALNRLCADSSDYTCIEVVSKICLLSSLPAIGESDSHALPTLI